MDAMSSAPHLAQRLSRCPLIAAALLCSPLPLLATPAAAQQAGYGQTFGTTTQEQLLYDGGSGKPGGGSLLDSANPLDLLNKIRRGTSLDDATAPSSAIDDALRQLDAQNAGPAAPGGAAPTVRPLAASPATATPSGPVSSPLTPPASSAPRPSL